MPEHHHVNGAAPDCSHSKLDHNGYCYLMFAGSRRHIKVKDGHFVHLSHHIQVYTVAPEVCMKYPCGYEMVSRGQVPWIEVCRAALEIFRRELAETSVSTWARLFSVHS